MTTAAAELAFERAAEIRDKLDVLRWLHERLGRLRRVRTDASFLYSVAGHDGEDAWYLIHRGRVAGVLPAPRGPAALRSAARRIRAVYSDRPGKVDVVPADEVENVWLVAAWFRRHVAERARVLDPAAALAACALTRKAR
jgi:hypothetical protein